MKRIGVIAVLAIMLSAAVLYFWQKQPSSTQTKEEAIRQAQEYQTNKVCAGVLVPAVHKATGAKYTFSSSCLAPGWDPER